jgi:hypothetical protein
LRFLSNDLIVWIKPHERLSIIPKAVPVKKPKPSLKKTRDGSLLGKIYLSSDADDSRDFRDLEYSELSGEDHKTLIKIAKEILENDGWK